MKKKLCIVLVSMITVLCLAFSLSACAAKVEFKVGFVVDGETVYTINTNGNEVITLPTDPEKEGFIFDGWYWDKDVWEKPFTAKSLLDVPLSSNMNVYCKWRPEHECAFTQKVAEDKYKASDATCTHKATYYYSCECGEKGTETFEYGELDTNNHDIQQHDGQAATCTQNGWEAYDACSRCDYTTYSKIDKLGHKPDKSGICTVCGNFASTDGLKYTLINNGQSYSVTGIGKNVETDIYIPSEYNSLPVTSIGYSAFYDCIGLTSVTMENGIRSIGVEAFYGCDGLTRVTIPNSVTSIDRYAFYDCAGLTSITIESGIRSIGAYAFSGCTNLETVNWNATACTTAGWSSSPIFYNCNKLTTVNISNNVTIIPADAFSGCSGLTSITLPFVGKSKSGAENTYFGYIFGAYSYSVNAQYVPLSLKTVKITGDTNIDSYAFSGCSGLTSVTIGNGVTSIGNGAFNGCIGLTSVTIGNGVTSIGNGAFGGCSGLMSITVESGNTKYYNAGNCLIETASKTLILGCNNSVIPTDGSVTSIGGYAFSGCNGLTSITIPDSVTSIEKYAFSGCSGLTSITIPFVGASKDGTSNTHFGYIFGAGHYSDNSEYVPSSLKTIIITGGTSIGDEAFCDCSGLTSIMVPDSVTSIGHGAFNDCSSLTSIVIPDGVTSIGSSALYGCSGLTSITLPFIGTTSEDGKKYTQFASIFANSREVPSSLKTVIITGGNSIGNNAFNGCSDITSITIPDSVTRIWDSAFRGCSSLTSVTIGNGVTYIGSAFSDCTSLDEIWYKGDIKGWCEISGIYDLMGCSTNKTLYINEQKIIDLIIPDGVTSIGDGAFSCCSDITSITIPSSVTRIGDSAFENCSGLTSIEIPNSVTSIRYHAFDHCSSLTSITIPNSVTDIGDGAFRGCSNLETVYWNATACTTASWYDSSYSIFDSCSKLSSVIIGNNVTTIPRYAFRGCSGLTSIIIPKSVTSIGICAFQNCSSLLVSKLTLHTFDTKIMPRITPFAHRF